MFQPPNQPTPRTFSVKQFLEVMGSPVAFYPIFGRALGNIKAGIFLSQLYYWKSRIPAGANGWLYKTLEEMEQETGLSRAEQVTARAACRALGIMQEAVRGVPGKLHYKIDWEKVYELLTDYIANHPASKPNPPPVTGQAAALKQMRQLFLAAHQAEYPQTPYVWQPRDGKALKSIYNYFAQLRLRTAPHPENQLEITEIIEADIIQTFQLLLENLPAYWRKNGFAVPSIYNNLNLIVPQLQTPAQPNGTYDNPFTWT